MTLRYEQGDLLIHPDDAATHVLYRGVRQPLLTRPMHLRRIWVGIGQMLECWQKQIAEKWFLTWLEWTRTKRMHDRVDCKEDKRSVSEDGKGRLVWRR